LPPRHSPPRITITTTTITTHTLTHKTIPGPKAVFCRGRAAFFILKSTRKRPES
jgi:hypothetical protein